MPWDIDYLTIRFTEIQTAIFLLEMKYLELIEEADLREQAGTWSRARGGQILDQVKDALMYYRAQLLEIIKQMGMEGRARTGVLGYQWSWTDQANDQSYAGWQRTEPLYLSD